MSETNDVAIVTGGTKGIGKQVSLQLAERGASVIATYHADEDAAADTEAALSEFEQTTGVAQFDVGDEEAVERAISEIQSEYGTPTILVNNAGTMNNGIVLRMSADDWNEVIRTNLTGAFLCSKEVLSYMFRGDGGAIVNVSSVAGLHGWAGQSNYAASKAGLLGLTRSLAREAGGKGIRVNAVCPGYTDTELLKLQDPSGRNDPEEAVAHVLEAEDIPQERIATPGEVANAIVFLASEDASYVNGSILRIDGGILA